MLVMQFTKCFVVLVALIGRICLCKMMIDINKSDGSIELKEAAITVTTKCYANYDKTAVLMGDFPANFIESLSRHLYFSLVLINDRTRVMDVIRHVRDTDLTRQHKVYVVVVTVTHISRMDKILNIYEMTPYSAFMASFLVLGWSPQNKYALCDGQSRTFNFIASVNPQTLLNLKVMCRHRAKGIVIFNSNAFTNEIPEPWQLAVSAEYRRFWPSLRILIQEYREHDGMCKNLDFDKTRDWGGASIKVVLPGRSNAIVPNGMFRSKMLTKTDKTKRESARRLIRRMDIELNKYCSYFDDFFERVNATPTIIIEPIVVGSVTTIHGDAIHMRPVIFKTVHKSPRPFMYPLRTQCSFIVTQFRGYKSQLQKIFDVIDWYSWVGMFAVYIITLFFFKYFLRQTLVTGILNLVRLTSNFGLTTLPVNVPSQIYLLALLFFVVTMQGIFVGNLAALLTNDIPVRQVNTLQDLIELGYSVRVSEYDLAAFDHPSLEGRVFTNVVDDYCIPYVQRDALMACLIWDTDALREEALMLNLYVSETCFAFDYYTNLMPFKFALEERLNEFTSIMFAGGILTPLHALVDEKRLNEFESQMLESERRVLDLNDLSFAFKILGTGLGTAWIAFIGEIMIYRFHRRVKMTPIIDLRLQIGNDST